MGARACLGSGPCARAAGCSLARGVSSLRWCFLVLPPLGSGRPHCPGGAGGGAPVCAAPRLPRLRAAGSPARGCVCATCRLGWAAPFFRSVLGFLVAVCVGLALRFSLPVAVSGVSLFWVPAFLRRLLPSPLAWAESACRRVLGSASASVCLGLCCPLASSQAGAAGVGGRSSAWLCPSSFSAPPLGVLQGCLSCFSRWPSFRGCWLLPDFVPGRLLGAASAALGLCSVERGEFLCGDPCNLSLSYAQSNALARHFCTACHAHVTTAQPSRRMPRCRQQTAARGRAWLPCTMRAPRLEAAGAALC